MAEPLVNPFEIIPETRKAFDRADTAQTDLDSLFTNMKSTLDQVQSTQTENLNKNLEVKQAINREQEATTKGLVEKAKPIFAKRAQIQDRLSELADMNPLAKGVLSIFSLNHNEKYLREKDASYAGVLQDLGSDFDYTTKLQNQIVGIADSNYNMNEQVSQLVLSHMDQDWGMVNKSYGLAMSNIDRLGKELNASTDIVHAQALARGEAISQMTYQDAANAYALAKRGGGMTQINGIEISAAEAKERMDQWSQHELSLQSARLSIQSQQMGLAAQHADNLVKTMTKSQVMEAINNGGVYQGVKLDQTQLTQTLQAHQARDSLVGAEAVRGTAPGQFVGAVKGLQQQMVLTTARMKQFGGVPQALVNEVESYGQFANSYATQVNKNPQAIGALSETAMAELQARAIRFESKVDQMALNWAGGDKEIAGTYRAFIRGEELSGPAAVIGLRKLAQSGEAPGSMRRTPMGKAVFDASRQAVAEVAEAERRSGTTYSAAGRNKAIEEKIAQKIPQVLVENQADAVFNNLNKFASYVKGPDGKSHPFSRVTPKEIGIANAQARKDALAARATQMGVTPQQAEAMFRDPNLRPKDQTPEWLTKHKRSYDADKDTNFLRNLDTVSAATSDTFKPSRAYVSLLQSPQFLKVVNNYEQLNKGLGLGDFLGGSIASGTLTDRIGRYGNAMREVQNNLASEDHSAVIARANSYGRDPYKRTAVILGAIPGIDQHEEALLLSALKNRVGGRAGSYIPQAPMELTTEGPQDRALSSRIATSLKSTKFEDPNLERIRKVAASHWDDFEQSTDNAIQRLSESVDDRIYKALGGR